MNYFIYLFFRFALLLLRFTPFWLLYFISDCLRLLLYYVIPYRKKVVFANLKKVFPYKSDIQIQSTAKKFYRNLTDITLESIKGFSVKTDELVRRYKILNPEVSNFYFDKKIDVLYAGAHYANWEWGSQAIGIQLKHSLSGLYKPLSNKFIDTYIRKHREKRNMKLVSIYNTKNMFANNSSICNGYIFVGDQNPSNSEKAYWTNFLGQDTACLHGIENYSKKYNLPVIYGNIQRVRRGYYEMTLSVLVDNPQDYTNNGDITTKYMKTLEKIILEKPEDWLWTHKRWKHSRTKS